MSKSDCIKWLKNPFFDPISNAKIQNKNDYNKWAIATLVQVDPAEIYEISEEMFNILGLNDIFEPITIEDDIKNNL